MTARLKISLRSIRSGDDGGNSIKIMEDNFYDGLKKRTFKLILKEVRGRGKILDMGCGNCELTSFLAKEGKSNVVGVDLNLEEEIIKEKNSVKCIKGDVSHLNNFIKETFSAAVSMYALHEFSAPFQSLKEVFKILEEDGKMVIVDFIKGTLADKLWGENYFTAEKIKTMMKRAGFKNIMSAILSEEGPAILTGIKKIK